MPSPGKLAPARSIENLIREIRGVRVILDSDLAGLYGVTTKRLNEQYRRNQKRFPEDFAFQLTAKETQALRSQVAASSSQTSQNQKDTIDWSQNETSSQRHRRPAYRPYAFTEHGALQVANIRRNRQHVARPRLCITRRLSKAIAAPHSPACAIKKTDWFSSLTFMLSQKSSHAGRSTNC